jgi:hypothetical protein
MSPLVRAVLELASEMSEDERAELLETLSGEVLRRGGMDGRLE